MQTYNQNAASAIQLTNVKKTYGSGQNAVQALRGVTAAFKTGSFTAIMGPSGSGKSTLLQCAAGLERPSSGQVRLAGQEISNLDEAKLTILRRGQIGFIFQSFNLMPSLTAAQNVELPLRLAGKRPEPKAIEAALRQVGLEDRAKHLPSQLSGGQQQRVAVARALANRPRVVFADEPTGALDSNTGKEVMQLMRKLVDTDGQTMVMVTHDPSIAAYADTVLFLVDGSLDGTLERPTSKVIAQRIAALER